MSTELTYFVLGVAVSIPVAVLAPFLTNSIQKALSVRSATQATKRREALQAEIEQVEFFHENPHEFTQYMIARMMLLNVLWISEGIIGSVIGVVSNGTYTITSISDGLTINVDEFSNILNASSSLLSVLILSITARIGTRVYRTWRRVKNFHTFLQGVNDETAKLDLRQAEMTQDSTSQA